MKSKAPEKIYIPRLEGYKSFVHEWSETEFQKYFSREIAENIEYVRTDAFIEKACKWLNDWFTDDSCRCSIPITKSAREDFFSDFKKYIKEE